MFRSSPNSKSRVRRPATGFTLLEVALGVCVLAMVFAGVMTAAVRIREVAVVAEATARANTVLSSKVEEFRAMDYGVLEQQLQDPGKLQGTVRAPSVAGVYPVDWVVVPQQVDPDYMRLRVRVLWTVDSHTGELDVVADFFREGVNQL
ncbi:type II secretion system protein [Actomonas aquatica]|uniref:Prepilin-type N-terminal cleavage/methylation domain-containing protein n=1 Tax=Actomonas aquatica TaxID=2866162 RepID=A0ABZ1C369_9BACT|nr:hypothetical protein [Opitutus sp. WL0086]WRQ85658.1 hypothetical protein K1X11_012670 [Opitutus sp. WL0086]